MTNVNEMASDAPASWRTRAASSRVLVALLATLIVLLTGAILTLGSVPPVDRDALTHHLAVPKLYLKHGGMVEIPSVPFSYFPMNLDLLYLIPLYFGNDIAPKYIHFTFALLTAWLIFAALRRRLEKPFWGLLGAFMFLSLPVIVKLSVTVYVDLGLIFFSTASLLRLLKWAEDGYAARHLLLSGLYCGLALGTKYNALISLLLLASLVPILYVRSGKEVSGERGRRGPARRLGGDAAQALRAAARAGLFVAVALLVYSPWMIRNVLWTGNPLYPLYQGVFSSVQPPRADAPGGLSFPGADDDKGAGEGMNHFIVRRLAFNESFLETLTIPIRIFFQGQDDNPRLFDGRLNPYLLVFPVLAFFLRKKAKLPFQNTEESALLGFSVFYILFAFLQADMRIRYVGPAIPPLVILSVLGVHRLIGAIESGAQRSRGVLAYGLVGAALVWFLGQNLGYVAGQFQVIDPVSYLEGQVTRDQYIQKYRTEYEVIRYANANLPSRAKIGSLYMGNRIYYNEHDMLAVDAFFQEAILRETPPEVLSGQLLRLGATHLLIRFDVLAMFAEELDERGRARLADFFHTEADPVFESGGYGLYRLRGENR